MIKKAILKFKFGALTRNIDVTNKFEVRDLRFEYF